MELYGLARDGAVLVRPDGHIAWRARGITPHPLITMRSVLRALVRR
jgi:putative polyketide hydroxylase